MNYTIGEVSDILNLSKDMIRYYEKQGVIQSHRNTANNYRYYDTDVIFWLLESIQFKNLGVNIKNIPTVRIDDYAQQLATHLAQYEEKLEKEIAYRSILIERLRQLKDRFTIGMHNIGKYWVAKIPAHYKSPLVNGRGDHYDKFTISKQTSEFVFSDLANPFIDSGFTEKGNLQIWETSIEEKYVKALKLELPEDFTYVSETLCFCTHIDMGSMGEFDTDKIRKFKQFALRHNEMKDTIQNEPINALLISRGIQGDTLHRILELRIPIVK